MKSLLSLYSDMLVDMSMLCQVSTLRDFKTITDRVKDEGLSFVTITLPNFCDDFERSLADGCVDSTRFLGFRKRLSLPAFLRGLMSLVFDPKTGTIRDNPDANAVFAIRQVCLMAKRIQLPCTEKRNRAAFARYVSVDAEVKEKARRLSSSDLSEFTKMADLLFGEPLSNVDFYVNYGLIIPKHGPGATADKLSANGKYGMGSWPRRLERNFFPASGFFLASFNEDRLSCLPLYIAQGAEKPVRVITVPKTLAKPRIIAIEPTCMQYAQQALLEPLYRELELRGPCRGSIRFTDQSSNSHLAQIGSLRGSFSTIDLSDASDRVSVRLAARLFRAHPALLRAVFACRSKSATVPGFGTLYLSKFASMGSALCFPVEAMVFTTIVFLGIQKVLGTRLGTKEISLISRSVRVFGDDIVLPTRYALSVMEELEAYGLKINRHKTFVTGKFRESCGGDYYAGVPVKPVRLSHIIPANRHCVDEYVSFVAFRNRLYKAGLWRAAANADRVLEGLGPLPTVGDDSPALGKHSFLTRKSEEKWDPRLQRWLVKSSYASPRRRASKLDGYGALMKFFLKRGLDPSYSKDHLDYSGRPKSVVTRLRWLPTL